MTFKADWWIGSIEGLPAYNYSIDGTGYGIAAGDYYLYDATGSRSMLQQLEDDMETENPGDNSSVFLTEEGYVRITADNAFSITWTDTAFRDWLGFDANIVAQTAVTAANKSPLFWSPSYPGRPLKSPVDIVGAKVFDTAVTSSPTGNTMQATRHHTKTIQTYRWDLVPIARVWTTDDDGLGGEFRRFYDEVLSRRYRMKMYPDVDESTSSTTEWSKPAALGPYKARKTNDEWYQRAIQSADTHSPIEIDVQVVDEYA